MKDIRLPKAALAAALAALGFSVGTAVAQTTATQTGSAAKSNTSAADAKSGKSGSLTGGDRTFVTKAAQGGMAEVEAGKVAQSKAQHEAVKEFAQHMVTDHSKANQELMSLAKSRSVEVPAALDKQHQAKMEKMNKLSGAEFDRAYMKQMVDDHRKTVADFEKQAKGGKDAELKSWAEAKLPALREHLKMAQSTHDQVVKGGPGKVASAGDAKLAGRRDPTKAVNNANPTATTKGSNTGNIAGADPKPATTGK